MLLPSLSVSSHSAHPALKISILRNFAIRILLHCKCTAASDGERPETTALTGSICNHRQRDQQKYRGER